MKLNSFMNSISLFVALVAFVFGATPSPSSSNLSNARALANQLEIKFYCGKARPCRLLAPRYRRFKPSNTRKSLPSPQIFQKYGANVFGRYTKPIQVTLTSVRAKCFKKIRNAGVWQSKPYVIYIFFLVAFRS